MNKKGLIGTIIIVLIVIAIIVGGYVYASGESKECKKRGLPSSCTSNVRSCYDNCNELEMDYFRYDHGGFASDECWCKINNDVKQIW